jgi:hypothetical protein
MVFALFRQDTKDACDRGQCRETVIATRLVHYSAGRRLTPQAFSLALLDGRKLDAAIDL